MRSARLVPIATAAMFITITSSGGCVSAQSLQELPGLQRAVVRAWIMPDSGYADVTITELNDEGTPTGEPEVTVLSTPAAATPDPANVSTTVLLSIGVFHFESDDAAASAYDTLAQFVVDTSDSDPSFAGGSRVEPGLGDQSILASATQVRETIPFTYAIVAVRNGSELYLLQGTMIRLDPVTEATRMMQAAIETPAGSGDVIFDPLGTSTGGLWEKYANVDPVLLPGTDVIDTVIYPAGEENASVAAIR